MFDLSNFGGVPVLLKNIQKLNLALEKGYWKRVKAILKEFLRVINQGRYLIAITAIFSEIAEHYFNLLPSEAIDKAMILIKSEETEEVKSNVTIILGQYLVHTAPEEEKFNVILEAFLNLLSDPSVHVRNNVFAILPCLDGKVNYSDYSSHFSKVFENSATFSNRLEFLHLLNNAISPVSESLSNPEDFTFRKRFSTKLESIIIQKYEERYNRLSEEVKTLEKHEKFEDALSLLHEFLVKLRYRAISNSERLRKKVQQRIDDLFKTKIKVESTEYYHDLVGKALNHYEEEKYSKAIEYMEIAIAHVKGDNFEERNVLLKDTEMIVKDIEFVFLCQDKIKERHLSKLIENAKLILKGGDDQKAKELFLEAQERHNEFSTLYRSVERKRYRILLQTIRNYLNQIN